jgi:polyisoprenoid-binding protein YceI
MKKIALSLLLAASYAQAAEYTTVQAEQSAIHFTYQQMGVKMEGSFRKFTAQLNFDPAKPNAAKAAFDVELASIDAGSSEADQEVAGKPWFNTKAFPTARFVSTQVKSLGSNRYEVSGQLSIKGQTRDVLLPATFAPEGKRGVFTGAFSIKRGDFNIGEGSWSKFDIVANDILIKFRITATSK